MNLTLDAKKYQLRGKINIELYATSEEEAREIVRAILRSVMVVKKVDIEWEV